MLARGEKCFSLSVEQKEEKSCEMPLLPGVLFMSRQSKFLKYTEPESRLSVNWYDPKAGPLLCRKVKSVSPSSDMGKCVHELLNLKAH